MRLPGFAASEYEAVSPLISAQQAVNVYPELGRNQIAYVGVPGTVEAYDFGAPIRALHNAWGRLFVVAGSELYEVSSAGVATLQGDVGTDSLPASMTHNVNELLCVSQGSGYTVQRSGGFAAITDTDFPDASICDFLDGYGMLLEKDSGRFRFTSISDFETISGIDFATAEGAPDDLVSLIVDHRELLLLGEYSIERWFNSGDATNPFQRLGFIEKGCKGTYSPAKLDNTVFWLGDDGVVYRLDDSTPVRVSNHGIENLISDTTVDPIGFAYTQYGHAFYQLTFPGQLTVVYDASTQLWHRRKTRGREDCTYQHHARCYGREYVGGVNGKLYYLDKDTFTHAGELERIRTFGPIRTDGWSSIKELVCLFETGANSDYLDEKTVWLEISDDAGRTYGERIPASIGTQGQYTQEVKFHALGGFYDGERVIKLTMTDDARYTLADVTYT